MLKKIISIIPVAVLSVTVGANVQAATITVQKGDTLWDLSRANNTTVENIQKLNQLKSDLIHPGDVLTVAQEKNYTVKQGDTLWNIARDHHVTVSQIKEWNQLQSDLIHPNLDLTIFEGVKDSNTAIVAKPKVQKESTSEAAVPTKSTKSAESAPKATAATESKDSTPEVAVKSASTTKPKESTSTATAPAKNTAESKEILMEATAYTASCEGCSGITATGIDLKANPNAKVISVDPSVIPLGSKVYVEGYGEAIAGDTGGAIKGNKIDVFIPSKEDAIKFGRKQVKVKILN